MVYNSKPFWKTLRYEQVVRKGNLVYTRQPVKATHKSKSGDTFAQLTLSSGSKVWVYAKQCNMYAYQQVWRARPDEWEEIA